MHLIAACQEQMDVGCQLMPTSWSIYLQYIKGALSGLFLPSGKKLCDLLESVCGPESPNQEKSIAKDCARVQHCVGVGTWFHLLGILEDHECGMNHDHHCGDEDKIRGAKSVEMITSTPIDANMQRVLQKIREDSKQQSKLHCVGQHHRGFGDSYAGNGADKQRPTSATNNEGKPNQSTKSGVPQACVRIWRFGSTTGVLQLRFWIP